MVRSTLRCQTLKTLRLDMGEGEALQIPVVALLTAYLVNRICPGRHLSNETMTFMAASLLSVFDIKPAKDSEGNIIPLKYDTGVELVSCVDFPSISKAIT